MIRLTKHINNSFKILWINILVVIGLFFVCTSLYSYLHGFYGEVDARHMTHTSYSDCTNSKHFEVSLEQAKMLNRNTKTLQDYCKSRASIPEKWFQDRTYWDYHYFSHVHLNTPSLKFKTTDYFNARNVPCSEDVGNSSITNVWLFGGSTMQNMETSDENTIANALCLRMNEISPTSILNLGVGSFMAEMEMHKFLNLLKFTIVHSKVARPDIAMFFDGYNDSQRLIWGKWSGLPASISDKFADSLAPSVSALWMHTSLQVAENYYLHLSKGKANFITNAITYLKSWVDVSGSNNELLEKKVKFEDEIDGVLLASRAYIDDQKSLSGICVQNKIKCYIVLQPLLPLRDSPVGKVETQIYQNWSDSTRQGNIIRRFYTEVSAGLVGLESPYYKVINLSSLPNEQSWKSIPFFYDFGHTGFFSGEIIGNAIARKLSIY